MRKLIFIVLVFMAGHYFGNDVIKITKDVYRVSVQEIQKLQK